MVKRTEKTCRKKQHVRIDDMKERSDLICGKAAVGGNYNSTRDNIMKQLGYAKALFHCEKIGTREASVGWVYGDGGADDVVSR